MWLRAGTALDDKTSTWDKFSSAVAPVNIPPMMASDASSTTLNPKPSTLNLVDEPLGPLKYRRHKIAEAVAAAA